MDFRLTEEQKLIQETARKFVDGELVPHVRLWEEKGEIPRSFYAKMAELGFLGAPVPEKYGGAGMDYEWVLDGQKRFISNGSIADLIQVYAREPGTSRHEGLSLFMVPKDAPGFKVTHVETTTKLGLRASPTADLAFEHCRIPRENLVGKRGDGWTQAMRTLNSGRIGIAAGAVGVARAALEAAVKYVKQRKAFGRPIGDFQLVREMIAQSALEVDAARLLTLRAAQMRDLGLDNTLEVSMAKLFGAQMAQRVTDWAIQVHGGYGFSGDFDVERYYRDARILGLYEGTNEIQKLIIADHTLGPTTKK
ncbi:MAG: acyl-CoA dehydrogenase [Methanobacteriota archaeon]|nr:MAG: acyl-CoA dehydrogenase [Euryarchaeota archaeon]